MGLLLKLVLFGIVFYYLIKTIGAFVYRLMGGQHIQGNRQHTASRRREGEINIDHMPGDRHKRRSGDSKDGDYIDYEEVK